jgi:hypothetical protein
MPGNSKNLSKLLLIVSVVLSTGVVASGSPRQSQENKADKQMISEKYKIKGVYPHYKEGDVLPDGTFPPLDTHENYMLTFIAVSAAGELMRAYGIDDVTRIETRNSMFAVINRFYEADYAEYVIAKYVLQDYSQAELKSGLKSGNIERLAEHYYVVTMNAAVASMKGSPLFRLGEKFVSGLTQSAAEAVKKHVLLLNDETALSEYRREHARDLRELAELKAKYIDK